MNPVVKKILWIAGGALVVSSIIGFQKVTKIKEIFEKMDIKADRISKFSVNTKEQKLRFNLDVKLINNSVDDLFVTGSSFASLKQVIIFYKDTYLATANLDLTTVQIPGNDELIIPNIPIEVDAVNLLQNITMVVNFKLSELGITGIINAMGTDYEIGGE